MAQMAEGGIVENNKVVNHHQIIGVHQVIMLGVQVVYKDKARKQQVTLGVLKRKLLKPQIPQMDGEVQKQRLKQLVLGVQVKLKLMTLHNLNLVGARVSQQPLLNRNPQVGDLRIKPKEVGDLPKKLKY